MFKKDLGFIIEQLPIGPMANFVYLIGDKKSKEALLIDPAWEPEDLVALVEKKGFKLTGVILTHGHFDHANGFRYVLKLVDVPVYVNKNEIKISTKYDETLYVDLDKDVKPIDGDHVIQLGDTPVTCLHTPGHTPGSQCIQVGNQLITGDTLFIGGCGRTDMPGGDAGELFKSLHKIASLPSTTEICPGHDYGEVKKRILKKEVQLNPYLKMTEEKQFAEAVSQPGPL